MDCVNTTDRRSFECFFLLNRRPLRTSCSGVIASVNELNCLLEQCDYRLWQHLEANEVDPRFYSFRWLTLMLSQGGCCCCGAGGDWLC